MSDSTNDRGDLFEINGFLFPTRLWFVVNRDGAFSTLPRSQHKGAEAIPAFTDEDLAQRWLVTLPSAERYELRQITDPLAVIGLLAVLKFQGVVYVYVDTTGSRSEIFSLDHFLATIIQHVA